MTSTVETPAPKVVCESQDCGKEYASKGGMKNHNKKTHKAAEEIQSPLGKFPTSDSARVLFKESEPSTQGNSLGQVNSPKVTSDGRYAMFVTITLKVRRVLTNIRIRNMIIHLP